jgi:hypothetical protein
MFWQSVRRSGQRGYARYHPYAIEVRTDDVFTTKLTHLLSCHGVTLVLAVMLAHIRNPVGVCGARLVVGAADEWLARIRNNARFRLVVR